MQNIFNNEKTRKDTKILVIVVWVVVMQLVKAGEMTATVR
jgi:hypothetical protein